MTHVEVLVTSVCCRVLVCRASNSSLCSVYPQKNADEMKFTWLDNNKVLEKKNDRILHMTAVDVQNKKFSCKVSNKVSEVTSKAVEPCSEYHQTGPGQSSESHPHSSLDMKQWTLLQFPVLMTPFLNFRLCIFLVFRLHLVLCRGRSR